jgi:hypothetical protein
MASVKKFILGSICWVAGVFLCVQLFPIPAWPLILIPITVADGTFSWGVFLWVLFIDAICMLLVWKLEDNYLE